MNRKLFGQKIKHLRKLHNLTQEKLAEAAGIDTRQIARIEAGENSPSIENLLKLAEILKVTPNDLLLIIPDEDNTQNKLKSDINDILSLAKPEQLVIIKKLILALL